MKVIVSDLGNQYAGMIEAKCDQIIEADGKYAPCQGCFATSSCSWGKQHQSV